MNLLEGVRCETVTVTRIGYRDVEKIISRGFGIPNYEMPSLEEWNNDTDQEMEIEPVPFDDSDRKLFAEAVKHNSWCWRGGAMMYRTRTLLCELCHRGQLPAGTYLINISW